MDNVKDRIQITDWRIGFPNDTIHVEYKGLYFWRKHFENKGADGCLLPL
jgi:hypothetical protein